MIYLASDHRGFELKEKLKSWLTDMGQEYTDCGPVKYDANDDYTDFVAIAAAKVAQDPVNNRAIVMGGSGQGEAMVANRRVGVRAAVFYGGSEEIVRLARTHNAANVLSLGVSLGETIAQGKSMDEALARRAVELFLQTPFSEDPRHIRRIAKIDPK